MKRRAVYLDRDGILNHVVMRGAVVSSPWSLGEFELLDGARELVQGAKRLGFFCVVVTNQPDVARGNLQQECLELMHDLLLQELEVDAVQACLTADNADLRRKPNPGMILESAREFGLDLSRSVIVGDSGKDLAAGRRAGVKTILLETDYNRSVHGQGDYCCRDHREILERLAELTAIPEGDLPLEEGAPWG